MYLHLDLLFSGLAWWSSISSITTTTNALTNNNVPISSPHQSSQIPEGLPIPGPFTSLKDLEFASDLHSEIYRSQFESQFELRHQQNLGLGNEEHGLEDLKKQTQSQVETTRCYSYLSCRSGDYWGNEYDLDGLSAMEKCDPTSQHCLCEAAKSLSTDCFECVQGENAASLFDACLGLWSISPSASASPSPDSGAESAPEVDTDTKANPIMDAKTEFHPDSEPDSESYFQYEVASEVEIEPGMEQRIRMSRPPRRGPA